MVGQELRLYCSGRPEYLRPGKKPGLQENRGCWLGTFLEILEYKAQEAWVQLVKVPPKDTSQDCSRCGRYVSKTPDVRKHDCPHCGFQVHRDLNTALNILAFGQRVAVKGS